MYIFIHVCMFGCMYVYMYTSMYTCAYMYINKGQDVKTRW